MNISPQQFSFITIIPVPLWLYLYQNFVFRIISVQVLQEMEHVSHSKSSFMNMRSYEVIITLWIYFKHTKIKNITYYRVECDNMGGTKDGTCADGFGICCIGMIWIGNDRMAEIILLFNYVW